MGVDEADAELARLDAVSAGITENLVALENHPGCRFLNDIPLTGVSAAQWASGTAQIALIWSYFAMFREVVERAHGVRRRHSRPGKAELSELTELLCEAVATLEPEEIPFEHRNLLGPTSVTKSLTVAELVSGMTAAYADVSRLVIAADAVRSTLLPELDKQDELLRGARSTADALGLTEIAHPLAARLNGIAADVDGVRSLAMSDPLSIVSPDQRAQRLPQIADEIASLRTELDQMAAQRDAYETRVVHLAESIDCVEATQVQARETVAAARAKVLIPTPITVPAVAATLRDRLAAVRTAAPEHHWTQAAAQLSELEQEAARALEASASARDAAAAMLDRRNELRARLDAYRVKAAQLRLSELPEIDSRYQEAHELLWRSPCDLPAATQALVAFQRAVSDRSAVR